MKTTYGVKDASKVFLWAVLLPQILAFLTVLIFSIYANRSQLTSNIFYLIVCSLIFQISFFIIFYYYNKKNDIDGITAIRVKTKLNAKNVVLTILISVIAIAGFVNYIAITEKAFSSWGIVQSGLGLPLNTPFWLIINIVLTCFIPAVMEEVIFRGIIFNGLKSRGFLFACIISSLMFAIVHFSLYSLIYPIIMGVIFCFIVQKTGSIVYSMICHFCNNLIITVINYINIVNDSHFGTLSLNKWWQGVIVSVVAIISFIAIIFIIKKFMTSGNNKEEQEKQNLQQVNVNNSEEALAKQDENKYKQDENKILAISLIVGVFLWLIEFLLTYL